MENTKYSNVSNGAYGEWLESSRREDSMNAWFVYANNRSVNGSYTNNAGDYGIRPVIEVPKYNISY